MGSSLVLCAAASAASSSSRSSRSVTLTDVNKDVLHILKQNIARNINLSKEIPITVQHLDWFDYLGDDNIPIIQTSSSSDDSNSNRYNFIIASDCIYLHEQISPLAETITKLLRRNNKNNNNADNGNNKLHMFSPYNRSHIVYELIDILQQQQQHETKYDMHVEIEEIELIKYRIKQHQHVNNNMIAATNSCRVSKFLHVTAWHKTKEERKDDDERIRRTKNKCPMDDID